MTRWLGVLVLVLGLTMAGCGSQSPPGGGDRETVRGDQQAKQLRDRMTATQGDR